MNQKSFHLLSKRYTSSLHLSNLYPRDKNLELFSAPINDVKSSTILPLSNLDNFINKRWEYFIPILAAASFVFPEDVYASNGEFGLLEGVPAGMIHPIVMAVLYFLSIGAAWQGYKWRSVRVIGDEIKVLKDMNSNTMDQSMVGMISTLQSKRSSLIASNPKDKHTVMGSILLGTGVFFSLEGGLSTYWRVGELFPGDHMFAGMGLTSIWAISYAITPMMAKGNVFYKNLHLLINVIGLGLFTWQVGTGLEIALNVWNRVEGW